MHVSDEQKEQTQFLKNDLLISSLIVSFLHSPVQALEITHN